MNTQIPGRSSITAPASSAAASLPPRRALFPIEVYPSAPQQRQFSTWDRLERRAERIVEIDLLATLQRPQGTPPLPAAELRALARLRPGHPELPTWLRAMDPTLSVPTLIALNRFVQAQRRRDGLPPSGGVSAASLLERASEVLSLPDTRRYPYGLVTGAVRGLAGPLFHRAGQPDEIALGDLHRPRRDDDPLRLYLTSLRVLNRTTLLVGLTGGKELHLRAELFTLPPWWWSTIELEHERHRAWVAAGKPATQAAPGQKKLLTPHPPITCGVLEQVGDRWQLLLRMSGAVAAVPPPYPAPDLGLLGLDPGKLNFLSGYDGLTAARPKRRDKPGARTKDGALPPHPGAPQSPGEVRFPPLLPRPGRASLSPLPPGAHIAEHRERQFGQVVAALLEQYRVGARYQRIGIEAPAPPGLQDPDEFDLPEWLHAQFQPVLVHWWASDVFPGIGRRWVVTTTRTQSSSRCPNCRSRPVRPGAPGGPTQAQGRLEPRRATPQERGLRVLECGTCGWRGDRDVAGAWNSWLDAHDARRPHIWANLPPVLLTDLHSSQRDGQLAPPDVLRWERTERLSTRRPVQPGTHPGGEELGDEW